MEKMSAADAASKLGESGLNFIDVRTPAEFSAKYVSGFKNIPLNQLDGSTLGERTPVFMCLSGKRAGMAAEKWVGSGNDSAIVIEGGIQAWEQGGHAVIKGEGGVSLERQVRIAAGLLVLTGVILGALVHPGFYGLAGFVGAGLAFAGITDSCAMGMLIAKAPWNRGGACSCSSGN